MANNELSSDYAATRATILDQVSRRLHSEIRMWFDKLHRARWERSVDRAWFFWRDHKPKMEFNRSRWPYNWRSLLRWMREDAV